MGGHMYGGIQAAPPLLSVQGPIARSAQDLEMTLQVIAGPDADSPANKLVLPQPRHERLASYRVFVIDQHPAATADADIRGAIEDLADELTREGASVARQSSLLPDLTASWRTYQAMLHTINTRRAPRQERPPISAHDWMGHLDDQQRLRRQWADFFRHFDIVLAPAFGTPAFPHTDEDNWRARTLMMDGQPGNFGAQLAWAGIATLANLPATAIPLGLNKAGLPLSVQAIGPFLEDLTTIGFAKLLGKACPLPALAA
jgi:amidase